MSPSGNFLDFIVPFRPKPVDGGFSAWEQVCSLLQQTVHSVCNSTNQAFRVLIIHHEKPQGLGNHPNVQFIQAVHEPPSSPTGETKHEVIIKQRIDKARKIMLGIRRSLSDNSTFMMPLDSDDLVSRSLVDYILTADASYGYTCIKGYRTDPRFPNWLLRQATFYRSCGSSNIIRSSEIILHDKQFEISTADLSNFWLHRYILHGEIPEFMNRQGKPLEPIPFHAVIYRFHRHNIYATKLRLPTSYLRSAAQIILKGQRLSQNLRDEFGYAPSLD